MSATSIKVGEINESGFLHNLFRKGLSFCKIRFIFLTDF